MVEVGEFLVEHFRYTIFRVIVFTCSIYPYISNADLERGAHCT